MKRIDYRNKTVIVTGASSGIGKELSFLLIKKYGCRVFAIARNEKRLMEAKQELLDLGDSYVIYPMDVSVRENWLSLAQFLKNSDTSVDILINCAGILPKFASVLNTDIEEYERSILINYMSQVYSCKIMLPLINKGGTIVNVSSSSALCPFALTSAYTASKSASMRFSESISRELKDVSVSYVMCGFVKTDIMKNQSMNDKEKRLINMFSSDCEKTVKKILRRVRRRKKRIVTGADGHFLSLMYRLFPTFAPKLIGGVLKKSGLDMFNN